MLVNGKWSANWKPVDSTDGQGGFLRPSSSFRGFITPNGETGFAAEAGRYHLYAGYICPWATRALITRKLKGLEAVVSVAIVEPGMTDEGWRFGDSPGADRDDLNGATYMHQIYTAADPHFTGRATIPALWDRDRKTIVNNESADIVRMFNSGFGALGNDLDLYPEALRGEIDALNDEVYAKFNNGVYRAGFATTQEAYEAAFRDVFATLDSLERRLDHGGPYMFGEALTESDIRVFVTLARFDAAYHGLFKCNRKRVADYPALSAFVRKMFALPAVRETFRLDHIKRGYYSLKALNPTGITPLGPELPDFPG